MPLLPFLHMLPISSAAIDNAIGVFVAREFIDTIGVTFGFIQVFLGIGSGLIFLSAFEILVPFSSRLDNVCQQRFGNATPSCIDTTIMICLSSHHHRRRRRYQLWVHWPVDISSKSLVSAGLF
jgi:hypothetical protein